MAWYWWALIVVGLIAIVLLKIVFVPKYFKNCAKRKRSANAWKVRTDGSAAQAQVA